MKIQTIHKWKEKPCGINLFNDKLIFKLKENNFRINKGSFSDFRNIIDEIIIFHYVPSLYSNSNIIEFFNLFYSNNKIITIFHGIYPNRDYNYLGDTINNQIKEQVEIITKNSVYLIFLSQSCFNFYKSWNHQVNKLKYKVLIHPGIDKVSNFIISNNQQIKEKYVFLGGIYRVKKDFKSEQFINLLKSLQNFQVKVWLHSTNELIPNEIETLLWKSSFGELSTENWNDAICNSSFVLCPYNSEIQTVSGIISESISCGKKILSTSFPYSIEMKKKYKKYVYIEENINLWANIIKENIDIKLSVPKFPNWNNFYLEFIKILSII